MSDPVAELTDKEKEALRLLLAGYDAKSSANELDISVHTLNDRLRSARRKLGVTTSKEAARLLASAENGSNASDPKSLVHNPLGVRENQENQDDPSAADRSETGIFQFAARRKGILIMSFTLALSLAILAVIPSQAPSTESASVAPRPSQSELQARRWLGLIDFGKFDESYEEAGEALRDQYSLGKWKFGLTLRMTKGDIQDRSLATVTRTDEFKGREGGEYEIVVFNSLFEYENRQIERVVLERVGSEWQVVDYKITPLEGDR
ncbi:hypothetical protein NAP1_06235 [Erythrobacter sp. NAP1]|uniref:helix-turn-helix domain-containing protein n=1 Tax=Erythrobacter sp. NAP1 TaxID=237727 RepID=UPI0000686E10|nr:DUF4019 domain-containing protein [Erythrobacter sp. NAP1]EAQ30353.1 hypothetical protein NAP1_06235 [Erythrobacter sp. NAP1]